MSDNIKIKQYDLKTFLYNFFIIWNLLIIVLLALITLYLKTEKIITPHKITNEMQVSAQFKPFWQSKNEFQKNDTDIYHINTVRSKNNKIYDFAALSKAGRLTMFNGENGQILWTQKAGNSSASFTVTGENIITADTNNEVTAFSGTGKKLWETKIEEPLKVKYTNTPRLSASNETGAPSSNLIQEQEKLKSYRITGKVLALTHDVIETRQGIYALEPASGKIKKKFNYFNTPLTGSLSFGKFNDDQQNDYLVCGTNIVYCIDGLTFKELWQKELALITAGNINAIYNKRNDLFILVPHYNGLIKILNKHGDDVSEININETPVKSPLVFKNKHFLFIQRTVQNNILAFNFEKRKNIWSLNIPETIKDIINCDIDYDNNNELFVLTENGAIYILNSENGKVIDFSHCLDNKGLEKVTSGLSVFDVDNDNNFELCFATDKGNVYAYKYVLYNKKFVFRKFLNSLVPWKK